MRHFIKTQGWSQCEPQSVLDVTDRLKQNRVLVSGRCGGTEFCAPRPVSRTECRRLTDGNTHQQLKTLKGRVTGDFEFAKTNTNGNAALILGIPVATAAGAVLLTVTAERTRTTKRPPIFKDWCGIA